MVLRTSIFNICIGLRCLAVIFTSPSRVIAIKIVFILICVLLSIALCLLSSFLQFVRYLSHGSPNKLHQCCAKVWIVFARQSYWKPTANQEIIYRTSLGAKYKGKVVDDCGTWVNSLLFQVNAPLTVRNGLFSSVVENKSGRTNDLRTK